jgi:uncharacterized protein (DUF427 family)
MTTTTPPSAAGTAAAGTAAAGTAAAGTAAAGTADEAHARGRVRVEPGQKRVRAYLGGELVADTTHPALVWENPHFPAYYLPAADVRATLTPNGKTSRSPSRGDATRFDVIVGDRTASDAAWRYPESPLPELRDLVRFEWNAMDEWLEEDEPVYVHPRSPYTRVDVLAASRHVRVVVDGVTVAETSSPTVLYETGLPPRYYLRLSDLSPGLLRPSGTTTGCPYKGTATYWSLEVGGTVHDDLVWTYRAPLLESAKIAGLVSFYPDRSEIYVDGERI